MDGIHYEVGLTTGRRMEVIIIKTKNEGFVGVAEDGFFLGVNANDFEEAKNLFVEAYEKYSVIEIVWD